MTVKVTICRGLPGSGKSYWAKQEAAKAGAFILEMDQYRAMFGIQGPNWDKKKEAKAFQCMLDNLVTLVRAGQSVIISNTHLNMGWLDKYRLALQFEDVEFLVADFIDVPLEVCLERNAKREGFARVPDEVIYKMHKNFVRSLDKDSSALASVMNTKPFELRKYTGTPGKPKAILVDFDGTLALMDGRGPYEFWRVDEDKVAEHVHTIVKMARAYGHKVIGCSGRDQGVGEAKTRLWMAKHGIVLDDLVMRKPGDKRRDDVVKHDLFWELIAPRFDVEFTLDDRNRVVDTWRAMGIPCLQVAPGDF